MNKVVLIGTGYMAREYCKVLTGLRTEFVVIGNSMEGVTKFRNETGIDAFSGGLENNTDVLEKNFSHAIVAVPVCSLFRMAQILIEHGIKSILLEKPGGRNGMEIHDLFELAQLNNVDIYIAYNRRFYSSVNKAIEMIEDNHEKIVAVDFEFTEWLERNYEKHKSDREVVSLFFSNSTHVVDIALFFAGLPKEISCYTAGYYAWSKNKTSYAGAGVTDRNVLISYHADWESPGRWSVDVITDKRRYRFCPLEELKVQNKNSVVFENVVLDNELDLLYKPGLYSMVVAFLEQSKSKRLLSISEFQKLIPIYERIEQ